MTPFFDRNPLSCSREWLEEGAVLLRGFAAAEVPLLVQEVARIAQAAAFRPFLDIAAHAAVEAGFTHYDPDACLINRYIAGAKLSLHPGP